MAWAVSSNILGGSRYATAALEEYLAIARVLTDESASLSTLATSWASTGLQMRSAMASSLCPALRGEPTAPNTSHTRMPFMRLLSSCERCSRQCQWIADKTGTLAELLIRAHSLYAQAESDSRSLVDSTVQGSMTVLPLQTALGLGVWSLADIVTTSASSRRSHGASALSSTSWAHQGMMNALGSAVDPLHALTSSQGAVNAGARRLTPITRRIADSRQGDTLTVTQVQSRTPVVTSIHSVDEALANLQRLGTQRAQGAQSSSGLDYATIAVQHYRKADGNSSWLVMITGTDGHPDSPLGWLQNVEAMSSDPEQRRHADSVRLVREAMERAGIGESDEVALVGHSQGGIVAASIAADEQDRYAIRHVVTAGSPIANHPIPEHTWVTSVEIDDELVASLDGASNPQTTPWLTVHGTVHQQDPADQPATPFDASAVEGVDDAQQISHSLPFHQAAYHNAEQLGSPAVQRHERHFQQIVDGELVETTYWQGRMATSP